MKKFIFCLAALTVLSGISDSLFEENQVFAEASKQGSGHINFTGDGNGNEGIRDPEYPDRIVDPGPSPSTTGDLRIDFVPQLNFSVNKITNKEMGYPVNAQLFHDETPARGNFIQVTDERTEAFGWRLELRQMNQFQNAAAANSQLTGAMLSFDKSWANSTTDLTHAPLVSKEVIEINNIGETYTLATAQSGNGLGTWSISFGASENNPLQLENTLSPRQNQKGEAMLDPTFADKQIYENSAITLNIPAARKINSGTYSTVLTWILSELP
ncbi:WxL domain-containing protein [uncultured Enterococcus sp.]|uniref:WxL domain-containing protein n=1 Tax=uncultured Enterococcus sp. TaxID=167972 RepID=UPI002AA6152D|nr:WxL domain-containing protein [uncultured Enterococcus sp.]